MICLRIGRLCYSTKQDAEHRATGRHPRFNIAGLPGTACSTSRHLWEQLIYGALVDTRTGGYGHWWWQEVLAWRLLTWDTLTGVAEVQQSACAAMLTWVGKAGLLHQLARAAAVHCQHTSIPMGQAYVEPMCNATHRRWPTLANDKGMR